jgi:hypothetical protein
VNLNKNKILGRLASWHFLRPPHENGPARTALSRRFKACIGSSKRPSTETTELYDQLDTFHATFLGVENSGAETGTIKRVVKEAFRLTVDGMSLALRLARAGLSLPNMDTREIREINKVANYWRICLSLAHLSRSYRTLFARIRLESIEPFAPSVWYGSIRPRHVHAEVQMLVYYEMEGPPIWPRVVGASKEACFLCNSFIEAHGLFRVSKAHRQVYFQWTVPDLANYSPGALDRLQRALVAVHQDVASALDKASRDRSFRPLPLQSSINLHQPSFPTPSVTTLHSSSHGGTEIANETTLRSLPPASPESDLLGFHQLSLSRRLSGSTSVNVASICSSLEDSPDDASEEEMSHSGNDISGELCWGVRLVSGCSEDTFPDWLDVHAYLERSADNHLYARTFSTASVNQDSVPNSAATREHGGHYLDLSKLAPGEQIVLSNPIDRNPDLGAGTEMNVLLTYRQMNPVLLRCSWHATKDRM